MNESEKKLLQSFETYFNKNNTLSEKQEDLLIKILKRRLILNIEYITVNDYTENYFKCDHHGDYLQSYLRIFSKTSLNGSIKDLHAEQYGTATYIDKYKYNGKVKIPNTIKNLSTFSKYYYNDFKELVRRFNSARTENSKFKIYKAIKSILNETYDDSLINDILRFKHWSA
jgi:hypothetical protein